MENEALPVAADQAAGAGETPQGDAPEVLADGVQPEAEQAEGDKPAEGEKKPERSPLEKELAKERRRNQALSRRTHEAEFSARQNAERLAELEKRLQPAPIDDTNGARAGDSEAQSAPRADRVREEAKRLLAEERLQQAAKSLRTELGEQFTELTEDLASVLDREQQYRVLRAEKPADVIRYLTDPDNADEADALRGLDEFDFGRAMARIEAKVSAKQPAKPEPSKAPPPLEAAKGRGAFINGMPDPANTSAYIRWANEQERQGKR